LRVVFLPSLIAPVEASACFGGAEMAALALAEGLADRGHEVTLIGLPGSAARGVETMIVPRGTPIFRPGEETAIGAQAAAAASPFEEIFARLERRTFDVFHLHLLDPEALILASRLAAAAKIKVVATFHLAALFPKTADVVRKIRNIIFTAPSAFAASTWPAEVRVVPNGIDPLPLAEEPKEPRLAWAGRRSKEKGLSFAAEIARRAKLPLTIAGADAPEGSVSVAGDIEDLGLLPRREVPARVFARATATLVTSTIPESFSLVAIESAACGTPVVAFDHGAHGVTGRLVPLGDVAAAAEACHEVAAIDRARCRERVLERFDHARTIDRFEEIYRNA
jgi:glycosyltransferase involved in cell wall biosynthesis